jgi:hypothetical protein
MKRILMALLVMSFIWLMSSNQALAGGFNLKSIGQLSTEGKQISHWWYSGSSPIMTGEAESGASVTVSVDGTESVVTADEAGNWSHDPGELAAGDHQIVLTSGGSNITFTLTMGAENVDWTAVESGSGEALPAAGNGLPTISLLILGVGMVVLGRKFFWIK